MPTARTRREPRPALRTITLIPVGDGRLCILGPDRNERAIFSTPSQANTYVQCLIGRLEADAEQLREARNGTSESRSAA